MSICRFSFNIKNWAMVCSKKLESDDWKKGETFWQENAVNFEDVSPKLAFLPPLKRRRLSPSARLFFESAWDLLGENKNIPVVYASSNGEINRNFDLWHSLLTEGDVSPTSFSLSVHNALVGQWSELNGVKAETTALTAQQDNLEIALLEAHLLLNEGIKQVLVVVAESPLGDSYNVSPIYRQPFSYALSLLVEKGGDYTLELDESEGDPSGSDNALTWVKHQHLSIKKWQTKSSVKGTWQWGKN
ncbi:beta-ketoacyl synthase chain length factor [Rodentibacter caecimuris]|uniref:beta-ketoacyl synthase chain length factor n=1 Tax=Rodentibacter caecimuris TaxID=1796644 RepID=UPI0013A09FE4|nr:beta-ketoacyl synthase chain length factor [Rodentibacter heylii]QIA77180.1 beta-ketoacyl synthase chain length factor [Rodentibacter heylii]